MTQMMLGQTVEGGRVWRLGGHNGEFFSTVIDVPAGMRVVRYTLWALTPEGWGIWLVDAESYSYVTVDVATGESWSSSVSWRACVRCGGRERSRGASRAPPLSARAAATSFAGVSLALLVTARGRERPGWLRSRKRHSVWREAPNASDVRA